jgi:hypothetical protein
MFVMDDADRAQEQTDLEIKIALKNRKPELPEVRACHWRMDFIEVGQFCDPSCRDDYDKYKRMKRHA